MWFVITVGLSEKVCIKFPFPPIVVRAGRFPHAPTHSLGCLQYYRERLRAWDTMSDSRVTAAAEEAHHGTPGICGCSHCPQRVYRKSSNNNSEKKETVPVNLFQGSQENLSSSHAILKIVYMHGTDLNGTWWKLTQVQASLYVSHRNKSVSLLQLAQMIFPPKHLWNNKRRSGQENKMSFSFYLLKCLQIARDGRISDRQETERNREENPPIFEETGWSSGERKSERVQQIGKNQTVKPCEENDYVELMSSYSCRCPPFEA